MVVVFVDRWSLCRGAIALVDLGIAYGGLYRQVVLMKRCTNAVLVVPRPTYSGLYRQVVLM